MLEQQKENLNKKQTKTKNKPKQKTMKLVMFI